MTRFLFIAFLLLLQLGAAVKPDQWTRIERQEFEYRWTRPANNACDVELRKAHTSGTMRVRVLTRYYAHKGQRQTEERKDDNTLVRGIGGKIHILGCEMIASVEVYESHIER